MPTPSRVHRGPLGTMRFLSLRALAAACLPALTLANVFSLSDLQWTLRNGNGSIVVPASVPSQAHLDLLAAGVIAEPLLGINGACRADGAIALAQIEMQSTCNDGSSMKVGHTPQTLRLSLRLFLRARYLVPSSCSTAWTR